MRKITSIIMCGILLLITACSEQNIEADILITGGTVYTGHNSPATTINIAIKDDRIIAVGTLGNVTAKQTIDASGMIVAPGFIDPHTHSLGDLRNPERKNNDNYLTQGVSTVFNGNDGGAPIDIGGTLAELTTNGIGTNTALFVGQGSIRREVMGMRDDAPTDKEMEMMKEMVAKGMSEGALGLSTGLYYAPGSYSSTEEVAELAKMVAPYDGIYESHIRDESTYNIGLLGAVKEVIDIGRMAGIKSHIGHIKALGVDVWGQSEQVIAMIEEARANGQRVTADQYPWLASGTGVRSSLLPRYVQVGGDEEMRRRLNDETLLPTIKEEMAENMRKRGGAGALLLSGGNGNMVIGRTLAEEAEARGKTPIDTAIEIILEGGSNVANFNMREEDVKNFMQKPWVMTSSDGSTGHPRKFATFPEKYREYVVNKKYISLQDFIHRSTGLTADTFDICDRGYIEEGKFADIVIFDPDEFGPKADYVNPRVLSVGVEYLLVNGVFAIEKGKTTNILSGRALRKCIKPS